MKQWLKGVGELLSKAWFSVPVALTALIGYGYGLTHEALHVDDMAMAKYMEENLFFEQGRGSSELLSRLLGLTAFRAGTLQLVGLLFFILAAAGFCSLFKALARDQLHKLVYPLFACFLISYPLIPAIWVYDYQALYGSICYLLVVVSLALANEWVDWKRGGVGYAALAALSMLLALTTYEAYAAVYVCGVFVILALRWVYGAPEERKLLTILVNGLKFAAALAAAAIVRAVAFPVFGYAPVSFETLIKALVVAFGVAAKWYLPIRILLCAVAALLIWSACVSRRRSKTIWLVTAGMLLSLVVLSFVTRSFKGYRSMQVAWLFVAATAMFTAELVLTRARRRWLRVTAVALLALLCFRQTVELDRWLHVDVQRYDEEVGVLTDVYRRVETETGFDKPVEYIGLYQLSDEIMEQCAARKDDPACRLAFKLLETDAEWFCYADSAVYSYLQYGLESFYPCETIEDLLQYNGMQYLRVGTAEMYEEANRLGADMPVWPDRGAIRETDDFVIVKLGEIWIPPDR